MGIPPTKILFMVMETITFGPFKGVTIKRMLECNPGYYSWYLKCMKGEATFPNYYKNL